MNVESEWPYEEKTWSGKWWLGVLSWFFAGRWLFFLFVLASLIQLLW